MENKERTPPEGIGEGEGRGRERERERRGGNLKLQDT